MSWYNNAYDSLFYETAVMYCTKKAFSETLVFHVRSTTHFYEESNAAKFFYGEIVLRRNRSLNKSLCETLDEIVLRNRSAKTLHEIVLRTLWKRSTKSFYEIFLRNRSAKTINEIVLRTHEISQQHKRRAGKPASQPAASKRTEPRRRRRRRTQTKPNKVESNGKYMGPPLS